MASRALHRASSHQPAGLPALGATTFAPTPLFLFTLLGFLPAASGLPGWSTEASVHKALPQAIPPLPIVWEPQLHWALKA